MCNKFGHRVTTDGGWTEAMAGVEALPGTRLLAVARLWDKCLVAVHVHRCGDDAARHLRAVVGHTGPFRRSKPKPKPKPKPELNQVVKSVSTVQAYPRLTITDQKAGTIH